MQWMNRLLRANKSWGMATWVAAVAAHKDEQARQAAGLRAVRATAARLASRSAALAFERWLDLVR